MRVTREAVPVRYVAGPDELAGIRAAWRPGLEFYRRRDEIDVLVPVA